MDNQEDKELKEDEIKKMEEKSALRDAQADQALKELGCLTSEKIHFMRKKAEMWRKRADEYAKNNTWKSIGIAALTGLVLGILIGKKSNRC